MERPKVGVLGTDHHFIIEARKLDRFGSFSSSRKLVLARHGPGDRKARSSRLGRGSAILEVADPHRGPTRRSELGIQVSAISELQRGPFTLLA